ncbi:MAG TPA: MarR family winged helix-turn-helix transcriptional regulator [Hyphomicrobiaceae bacterium]|nr:MarR family winged helix-turn-helix transcriptional regulator [Hyphomicrobiaceae bacterium]
MTYRRSPATELLDGCAAYRFRKAARRVSQIYDKHLACVGLTITQYGLLANIGRNDGIGIGSLAEMLVMDPTTLTRNIRPLQTRDLIAAKPDKRDRRNRTLHLTPAGTTMLKAARPEWEKAQRVIADVMSDDAPAVAAAIDRMLARLAD